MMKIMNKEMPMIMTGTRIIIISGFWKMLVWMPLVIRMRIVFSRYGILIVVFYCAKLLFANASNWLKFQRIIVLLFAIYARLQNTVKTNSMYSLWLHFFVPNLNCSSSMRTDLVDRRFLCQSVDFPWTTQYYSNQEVGFEVLWLDPIGVTSKIDSSL